MNSAEFGQAADRSPYQKPCLLPTQAIQGQKRPLPLALTPMAKRSTPCIFGELTTVVRLRGSPKMSPSVSTTMTLDALLLEPWLGVKTLSLSR